ncbi:redoxin domain-containing protein [Alteromonas oceanisediminis]|uniref:redoxin domain-containing protein n=1 Tax=Alteromonas oceanisediminis TaxID=2836180 RepID=UPI001BD99182|nr:redoxin domain-containing protein [Alteromonas oceanisediminis]MBT0587386.1 redoxin domain-containing protein [Alteromonas oceanisediminis]
MNKYVLGFFAFIALSFNAFAAITIDKPAPQFTLTDSHGQEVSLSDFAGKYVVLEWTNHLCPYVQKHYQSSNMQQLQTKYTEQDVVWLSIISSAPGKQGYVDADEANQLTSERSAVPTHVLFDPSGEVGKQYAAKTTPHMYIIDPQGSLKYAGGIDSIKSADIADIAKAVNYVDTSLSALLSGETVDKPLTPPYGCSIKYAG